MSLISFFQFFEVDALGTTSYEKKKNRFGTVK
jgi:hypothetical protein